ncbi:MAG: DAK2 domain-containing protein [Acidimicrobiia bacterium]|nr:DAK2 domain-containing protein [Acidimicrobiia bacterium]
MSPSRLDAAGLRATMAALHEGLVAHREAINRLNVYPVPDGDTGTNMSLTIGSVCAELDALGDEAGIDDVCEAIAHGSLMGARGNSGVILCQLLRGLAGVWRSAGPVDGKAMAEALSEASDGAYGAVGRPVEGTILTVVRVSAETAAAAADNGHDLLGVLEAARRGGGEALERTPELLPVLAEAGVVDAGGTGYLLLLDALLHVADGRPMPEPPALEDIPDVQAALGGAGSASGGVDRPDAHDGVADLRYEVMYFLEAPDESVPGFKDVWATVGDSIVVVGGDGLWNCHIHTDDIGAAVEAGIEVGRPRQIRVTDLLEELEEEQWVRDAVPQPDVPATVDDPVTTAVVAVATGDGIRRIFHSLGVQRVVTGGQTMNPSTADLLAAVEAAPGPGVVILPNNSNIVAVARQVDSMTTKAVRVVPTTAVTEGFAALAVYDPEAEVDDVVAEMTGAADDVVAGEVTRAVRDSSCDLGPIHAGDWLGLGPGGILSVDPELAVAAERLLAEIVTADREIVTIIEGDGATSAATRHLELWLGEHRPGVAAEVHPGGQPLYPYLFGVE